MKKFSKCLDVITELEAFFSMKKITEMRPKLKTNMNFKALSCNRRNGWCNKYRQNVLLGKCVFRENY